MAPRKRTRPPACSKCLDNEENISGGVCEECGLCNTNCNDFEVPAYAHNDGALDDQEFLGQKTEHSQVVHKTQYKTTKNAYNLLHPPKPQDEVLDIVRAYLKRFRSPPEIRTLKMAHEVTFRALDVPERKNPSMKISIERSFRAAKRVMWTRFTENQTLFLNRMTPNTVHHLVRGVLYYLGTVPRLHGATKNLAIKIFKWMEQIWRSWSENCRTKTGKKKNLPSGSILAYILRNVAAYVSQENQKKSENLRLQTSTTTNLAPISIQDQSLCVKDSPEKIECFVAIFFKALNLSERRKKIYQFLAFVTEIQNQYVRLKKFHLLPNHAAITTIYWQNFNPKLV